MAAIATHPLPARTARPLPIGGSFALNANPFQLVGFGVLLAFLFSMMSRFWEFTFPFLHIATITWYVAFSASVFNGGLMRSISTRVGKMIALFTLWGLVCIPFSFWRRGALDFFIHSWMLNTMAYVAVCGLVCTYMQARKAIFTIGLSTAVLAVIGLFAGTSTSGRLFLRGKFENPNDLAQALLIGLPCIWLFGRRKNAPFSKVLSIAASAPMLVVLMQTGSRGGLVGLAVVCFLLFLRMSLGGKLKMILAGALVLVITLAALPDRLRLRYLTMFQDQQSATTTDAMSVVAVDSALQRRARLRESIELTLKHPIFGVGPGQFSAAAEAAAKGFRPDQVSHNSYTQVSSETGLIGLGLYMTTLVFCWKVTRRVRKFAEAQKTTAWDEVADTAFYLGLAVWAFAATALFSSVAFQSFFPLLAGITAAFGRALEPDMRQEAKA